MNITPFEFFLFLGVGLVALELLVFQLSLLWMLFVGLGALTAMLAAYLIPELSWMVSVAVFVIASTLISLSLFPLFKRWQSKTGDIAGHDAINQEVDVTEEISEGKAGKAVWSGADWTAMLAEGETESIPAGSKAYISKLEGIRLSVRKNK